MMKKYIILLLTALLSYSCVRHEANQEDVSLKTIDCFVADIECSSPTKIGLERNGDVSWEVGDRIWVFSDIKINGSFFTYDEDGKFYGDPLEGHSFYAVYPVQFRRVNQDNPLTLGFSLLPEPPGRSIPMVAKSDGDMLSFRQVGGILHLNIRWTEPISSISLRGNNQEILWGYSTVDLSEDSPLARIGVIDENKYNLFLYVNLTDVAEEKRDDIYFFLPEMTFTDGFTVTVNADNRNYEKATYKTVSISRATMKTYRLNIDSEIEEGVSKDREALIALYNALDGQNWLNKENWCTDAPLEDWYGVYTNSDGRVVEISLPNNNLQGKLPPEIGNLDCLYSLELASNYITSPLPDEITKLGRLSALDLEYNRLTGPFPEQLRALKNLYTLRLSGPWVDTGYSLVKVPGFDYLSGPLPEWISELKNLRNLSLDNNHFSGTLPESLGGLEQLFGLGLSSNDFTGEMPDISEMTNLSVIQLNNCFFSGSVPRSFARLMDNDNNRIIISENCLSGQFPDEILGHPNFSEFARDLLLKQRPGYVIPVDDSKIPACRHIFDTFDDDKLDLGSLYSQSDYTMIIRWAEWCRPTRVFMPLAVSLADKYKNNGMQTVWAYCGGHENARIEFMKEFGLDKFDKHIIEIHSPYGYDSSNGDHVIWSAGGLIRTPFVEIVNHEGNIVFIDDQEVSQGTEYRYYDQYSFSHKRSELPEFLSQLFPGLEYESTDFSSDGQVHVLQRATVGEGVNVVLMGDAFSDRMIADGTYETVMQKAVAALFSEEPYMSHKDYFNVYYIDVVSKNEVYYGESALSTWYGNGTSVGGDDAKVFDYAKTVLSDQQIDDALILVMMNRDYYAGTCYMYYLESSDYGRGPAIAYFPTSNDTITFDGLVSHEAGGHGFAKLADEYYYSGSISVEEVDEYHNKEPFGWWKNVDFSSDPTQVKWAQFLNDDRYTNEGLGVFEGACTYAYGAWRPTEDSIMNHNTGGFNAPSRYAIWYRINKLAYGDEWQGTYEDFVEYDKINRTPAAIAKRKSQRRNFVEKDFEPLAPPVIVNKDWREMLK